METLYIYETKSKRPELTDPQKVFNFLKDIKDQDKEMFIVFYLDTKNKAIAREIISIGILDSALIHPRELFKGAIVRNAKSVIIAHNHPSGDPQPSIDDNDITEKIKAAGDVLCIPLLDHVIVGESSFYSYQQEKQL